MATLKLVQKLTIVVPRASFSHLCLQKCPEDELGAKTSLELCTLLNSGQLHAFAAFAL